MREKPTWLTRRWPDYAEFAAALAIVVMARGGMIFPLTYAADDYGVSGAESLYGHFVSQMRWPTFWVTWLVEKLGGAAPFLGTLWPAIASAALVFFGMCLRKLLVPQAPSMPGMLVVLLFALFPYHTETLTFRHVMPAFSLYVSLTGLALILVQHRGWRLALGVLALSAACAYPLLLPFVVAALLITALAHLPKDGNVLPPLRPAVVRIVLLVLVLAAYVAISKFYISSAGLGSESRVSAVSEWSDPATKLRTLASQTFSLLASGTELPLVLKWLQIALGCTALGAVIFRILSTAPNKALGVLSAFLAGLTMAGAFLGSIFAAGIFDRMAGSWNLRTLSGLGVFWAGIFALAWIYTAGLWRKAVLVAASLLVAGYAFRCNEQSSDFAQLNMRDHLLANRIVERLSIQPGFSGIRTVVVLVGYDTLLNTESLRTSNGAMGFNISALVWDWSKTQLLGRIGGYSWPNPTEQDEAVAREAAASASLWPEEGSVFVVGDIGVVVMGR